MNHPTAVLSPLTIGLDLGDRQSHAVAIDAKCHVVSRQRVPTTRRGLAKWFGPAGLTNGEPCRVVIEASTHSPWVCSELRKFGHEVVVANPRKMMRMGGRGRRKNDMLDAEELARIGRIDPKLLAPIHHRGDRARADLALIRVRNEVVAVRTSLVT
jgi:transposase